MPPVKVSFIIGQLREDEFSTLQDDGTIVSKMFLSPEDFSLFKYNENDLIQVESQNGNRVWCKIQSLEILEKDGRFILIFTLERADIGVHPK